MSVSGRQVQRMLALVPYLQANDGIPVDRVAAEFGVPAKIIRRDLERLMMTGIGQFPGELIDVDLTALETDGIVRIRDAEFMTRPLRVSPREAAALIVALRMLRETADADQILVIDSALAKLEHAAGESVQAPAEVHVEAVDEDLRRRLGDALAAGVRVRLTYDTEARDESTVRDVDPLRLFVEAGRVYLEAWCHRAGDMRFFRLDRISAAEVLEEPVEQHAAAGERLGDGLFTVSPDSLSATLRVKPSARWLVEHHDAEVVDDSESDWTIVLPAGDAAWLRRLVLRLAGQVTVLEPAELRDEVVAHAQLGLAAYDGATSATQE